MKLRAEIVIEVDASDFVRAAEHQRQFEELHALVSDRYPQAILHFRERRAPRVARRLLERPPAPPRSARGNEYID